LTAFPDTISTSVCNFSFQVTITDPNGVASALVQWQVVDKGAAVIFGPNSQPMTNDGDWYASISGFDVPAGGSVVWSVTAINVLQVSASAAGPAIVDSLGRGCLAR
jgi:hypothetical protein